AQVQALIERNLVVAGAPGMELAAHGADEFDESALDVHVDVFELLPEGESAVLELASHRLEATQQGRQLVVFDEPCPPKRARPRRPKRARPRRAAFEVVGPQAAIEGERCGEGLGPRIGPPGEATGPRLVRRFAARGGHEWPARPIARATGSCPACRRAAISP